MTEVRGVPDESCIPSVFLNYQTVTSIKPSEGSTGTWDCDFALIPHPVAPLAYRKHDTGGDFNDEVLNSQLAGVTHDAKYDAFATFAKRWRLAYMSVTIYQDGPDLSNQGTVVACQKPVQTRLFNSGGPVINYEFPFDGTVNSSNTIWLRQHIWAPNDETIPDYESSQGMPNAYFSKSKEGVYMPLRLTKTHQQWRSRTDEILFGPGPIMSRGEGDAVHSGQLNLPAVIVEGPGSLPVGAWPFATLPMTVGVKGEDGNVSGDIVGQPTSNFLSDVWGDICFRGLSVNTSLSCFIRLGLEVQVAPKSELAPHMKLSPRCDLQAIESYFAISRELKDAYPADYNDAGKIWTVISNAAKTIAPFLSAVPGFGSILSTAVSGAATAGDLIAGLVKKVASDKSMHKVASQADLERAQAAVKGLYANRTKMAGLRRERLSAKLSGNSKRAKKAGKELAKAERNRRFQKSEANAPINWEYV